MIGPRSDADRHVPLLCGCRSDADRHLHRGGPSVSQPGEISFGVALGIACLQGEVLLDFVCCKEAMIKSFSYKVRP